tara:strand:+ start:431 stop:586 length:156 start_codon:yes stop_codon:yes gene_type:complete
MAFSSKALEAKKLSSGQRSILDQMRNDRKTFLSSYHRRMPIGQVILALAAK